MRANSMGCREKPATGIQRWRAVDLDSQGRKTKQEQNESREQSRIGQLVDKTAGQPQRHGQGHGTRAREQKLTLEKQVLVARRSVNDRPARSR